MQNAITVCGHSTKAAGPSVLTPRCDCILRVARDAYAITNLLYGAACPSSLSSLTMGEIDLLVS